MSTLSRVAQRYLASLSDNPEKWRAKTKDFPREKSKFIRETTFKDFTLYWRRKPSSDFDDFSILATVPSDDGERVVGDLFYGPWNGDPSEKDFEGAIEVDPEFRRQGLATAMYAWAERISGQKFRPATSHTDAAEALWKQKHRPFGR
jgi:GNAT superfamily N-acetyltransferase